VIQETRAHKVSGDDIPAQTLCTSRTFLSTVKQPVWKSRDADFLASTALDIVFRHPYTLNTNFHATSQTADVQVQWLP
jgi:hypothetical protein